MGFPKGLTRGVLGLRWRVFGGFSAVFFLVFLAFPKGFSLVFLRFCELWVVFEALGLTKVPFGEDLFTFWGLLFGKSKSSWWYLYIAPVLVYLRDLLVNPQRTLKPLAKDLSTAAWQVKCLFVFLSFLCEIF